jgi:hypothetical protein
MYGTVDYTLAKRSVLRDLRAGRVSRMDVCDAHPDLVRAARYSGDRTFESCPVCRSGELLLVAYAFADELKKENGRVWPRDDIAPLGKFREARLYTVEVCPDCSWNHLRSAIALGRGGSRREASK